MIKSDRSAIEAVYRGGEHYFVIVRSTPCGKAVLDRELHAAILREIEGESGLGICRKQPFTTKPDKINAGHTDDNYYTNLRWVLTVVVVSLFRFLADLAELF